MSTQCKTKNEGDTADAAGVPALLTIYPQTARVLGLSRGATYRAAARGDLPLMPLGKLKKVVTAKLAEKIGRPITLQDIA